LKRWLSVGWLLCTALYHDSALAAPAADVIPPQLLSELRAPYPAGGKGNAVVVLDVWVNSDGDVVNAELFIGTEPFARAAIESARSWRFEPALRGSSRVAAKVRVAVRFRDPTEVPRPQAEDPPDDEDTPPADDGEPIAVRVLGDKRQGRHTLDRDDTDILPGAFGDPLRAIDVLPGVAPIVNGTPYVFIRGAPPGNVGYYLDGIPIPWVFHAGFGNSVVSPALIDRVHLYPVAPPLELDSTLGAAVQIVSA
jgi:TonB family protein